MSIAESEPLAAKSPAKANANTPPATPADAAPSTPPAAPRSITLKNVGPVELAVIPAPVGGGIVLLRGRNGRGKSETLKALDSIVTGKQPPSVKRGAARGSINGLGITINLSKRATRKGELEVDSMADKFGVSDLIEPGIKDPVAADAKRIKSLLTIAGGEVTPDEWRATCGSAWSDDMAELIDADPVETAARIAKHLQAKAREHEKAAEERATRAKVLRENAGEYVVEIGEEEASRQLEEAIRADSKLKAEADASEKARKRQNEAREKLATMKAAMESSGGTVESIAEEVEVTDKLAKNAAREIEKLELTLTLMKADHAKFVEHLKSLNMKLSDAKQRTALMAKLQETIDENIATIAPETLEQAAREVDNAKAVVAKCVLAKESSRKLADAKVAEEESEARRKQAIACRAAADKTDDALSAAVGKLGCKLRVSSSRLKAMNSQGDEVDFAELSAGEKAKVAVDIVADAAGEGNLFVLDQPIWEGLDPIAKADVWRRTRERGVLLYTAQATEDETITAVEFEPGVYRPEVKATPATETDLIDAAGALDKANRELLTALEGF